MEKQQQNTKAETASRHNGRHDKAQQAGSREYKCHFKGLGECIVVLLTEQDQLRKQRKFPGHGETPGTAQAKRDAVHLSRSEKESRVESD